MSTRVPALVIGAGVAGLASSAELRKHGVKHIVLAKDVGGRIVISPDGVTNYGAYLYGGDSRHIPSMTVRGRRLGLHRIHYHGRGAPSFRQAGKHPFILWRFFRWVRWFQRHYRTFQERAETIGQRAALQADDTLFFMYSRSAREWLEQHELSEFSKTYIDPIVRMCTFSGPEDISTFEYFHVAMHLNIPVYEFATDQQKLEASNNSITIDEVDDVIIGPPHRVVTKAHGSFAVNALILATPIEQTRRWLAMPYDKTPRRAWMYHLRGPIKDEYRRGDIQIFRRPDNTLFLSVQPNGTYLCYRLDDDRDFSNLFQGQVELITARHWDPAFWMGGTSLLDVTIGPQVFLAGDHNIVGMEDAFISGVAAARALISDMGRG